MNMFKNIKRPERMKAINCDNCDTITEVNTAARDSCPKCGSYRTMIIKLTGGQCEKKNS